MSSITDKLMKEYNEREHYEQTSSEQMLQLVTFCLGEEEYAVDIGLVVEIITLTNKEITPVPKSLFFVKGVMNLRGNVVPVVDLNARFDIPRNSDFTNKKMRIIVVETDQKTIGFIVDKVNEVLNLPKNFIEKPPGMISNIKQTYLKGLGKLNDRLIILLNIIKILSEEELEQYGRN